MKKRLLALALAVALTLSLMPTTFATDGDYGAELRGTTGTIGSSDVTGITFDVNVKGTTFAADQRVNLNIKVDTSKLMLVKASNGASVDLTSGTFGVNALAKLTPNPLVYSASIDEEDPELSGKDLYYLYDEDADALYLSIQPTFGKDVTTWTDYTTAVSIAFAYVGDTTIDDIDATTIQLVSTTEAGKPGLGQNAVAIVPGTSSSDTYQYGVSNIGTPLNDLDKPLIYIDDEETSTLKPNLNAVTATVVNKDNSEQEVTAINVPASYDENGEISPVPTTDAVVVSAKAFKSPYGTDELTEEEYKAMKWTYSLDVKQGDLSNDDYATVKASVDNTVSIDSKGQITITAGAPACTLLISVTGQWDTDAAKNKNRVVTSDVVELELCHGDARTKEDGDPDAPGPNDETVTLRGVKIVDANGQLAISTDETASDIYATQSDGEGSLTFTAVEFNQYGDAMKNTEGKWSTGDETADLTVKLDELTVNEAYDYSYTAKTYTAAIKLHITNYKVTWGTLASDKLTYGEKLAIDGDESVIDGDTDTEVTDATWSWANTDDWADPDIPNAGTKKVTRQCIVKIDGVDTPVATKDYYITVAKADQNITIAGDTATTTIKDFVIDLNRDVELGTVVTNAKVDELIEAATAEDEALEALPTLTEIEYTVEPDDGVVSVNAENDTIKGTEDKAEATLTITAKENDNYNEAHRSFSVTVVQFLHANIVFAPNPTDTGVIYGETVTATITDDENQKGSLEGCTYNWGYYEDGVFTPIKEGADTADDLKATARDDGYYTATVTHETTEADIGKTLAIQVITPTSKQTGYNYADSVMKAMEQPIAKKANEKTLLDGEIQVVTTTRNSIIVNYIEGAEYAIELKAENEADQKVPTDAEFESNEYTDGTGNSFVTMKDDKVVDPTKTDDTDTSDNTDEDKEESGGSGENDDNSGSTIPPEGVDSNSDDVIHGNGDFIGGSGVNTTDLEDGDDDNNGEPKDDAADENQTEDGEDADETKSEDGEETTAPDGYRFLTLDGKELEADTEYVVYARIKATDTVAASNMVSTDAKTKKPDYTDSTDVNGGGKEKATVTLSDDVAVGKTLTATINDPNTDPVFVVVGDNATADVQWYRVQDDGTKELIDNTASENPLEYTITSDDMGCNIMVEISLNADQPWDGVISAITKNAVPSGYTITGTVVTFNAKVPVYYELYLMNADGSYPTDPTYSGIAVAAEETTTAAQQTQTFAIENVASTSENTSYKLVIKKDIHIAYTIEGIKVGDGDVNLADLAWSDSTKTTVITTGVITMCVGDLDRNGAVNSTDASLLCDSKNYNKDAGDADATQCDIDGNESINSSDLSILVSTDNYNKTDLQFVFTVNSKTVNS